MQRFRRLGPEGPHSSIYLSGGPPKHPPVVLTTSLSIPPLQHLLCWLGFIYSHVPPSILDCELLKAGTVSLIPNTPNRRRIRCPLDVCCIKLKVFILSYSRSKVTSLEQVFLETQDYNATREHLKGTHTSIPWRNLPLISKSESGVAALSLTVYNSPSLEPPQVWI